MQQETMWWWRPALLLQDSMLHLGQHGGVISTVATQQQGLVSNPPGGFFCVAMHVFVVPVTHVSIAETTVVHRPFHYQFVELFQTVLLHLQKYIHKINK